MEVVERRRPITITNNNYCLIPRRQLSSSSRCHKLKRPMPLLVSGSFRGLLPAQQSTRLPFKYASASRFANADMSLFESLSWMEQMSLFESLSWNPLVPTRTSRCQTSRAPPSTDEDQTQTSSTPYHEEETSRTPYLFEHPLPDFEHLHRRCEHLHRRGWIYAGYFENPSYRRPGF